MRIDSAQLAQQLAQALAPVYLLSGDEPLLLDECCAAIRARAAADGYERNVYTVESGFDWNDLFAAMHAPSLFAPRSLYELRIPSAKPGEVGAKMLAQLAEHPPAQTVLLVVCAKLDKTALQSKWVQALEAAGVGIALWPIEAARLPLWLTQRMQARGVQAAPGVAELLAYHMEGNLLAAAQEIDKLALLFGAQRVELEDIAASLSDNSRFSVYAWVDACIGGDSADCLRKLARLRTDASEPALMIWALVREVRSLAQMAQAVKKGKPVAAVLQEYYVWAQRKPVVTKALQRLSAGAWLGILSRAAHAERVLKGRAAGDIWFELELLSLACGGVRTVAMQPLAHTR